MPTNLFIFNLHTSSKETKIIIIIIRMRKYYSQLLTIEPKAIFQGLLGIFFPFGFVNLIFLYLGIELLFKHTHKIKLLIANS